MINPQDLTSKSAGTSSSRSDSMDQAKEAEDGADETNNEQQQQGNDDEDGAQHNQGGKISLPFPVNLHALLDDAEANGQDDIVSFLPCGKAFTIHKQKEFANELMPRYFKTKRLASFQRQLLLYGFKRFVEEGKKRKAGYYHEFFIKGEKSLSLNITRKTQGGTATKAHATETLRTETSPFSADTSSMVQPGFVSSMLEAQTRNPTTRINSSLSHQPNHAANITIKDPFEGLAPSAALINALLQSQSSTLRDRPARINNSLRWNQINSTNSAANDPSSAASFMPAGAGIMGNSSISPGLLMSILESQSTSMMNQEAPRLNNVVLNHQLTMAAMQQHLALQNAATASSAMLSAAAGVTAAEQQQQRLGETAQSLLNATSSFLRPTAAVAGGGLNHNSATSNTQHQRILEQTRNILNQATAGDLQQQRFPIEPAVSTGILSSNQQALRSLEMYRAHLENQQRQTAMVSFLRSQEEGIEYRQDGGRDDATDGKQKHTDM